MLGNAVGVFSFSNSDFSVGSYFKQDDLLNIFVDHRTDVLTLPFENVDGVLLCDERHLAAFSKNVIGYHFDEVVLSHLIKMAYPDAEITHQVRVGRFQMDLQVKHEDKNIFIEFDGPSHFVTGRYGRPSKHPFDKKEVIESKTGIEVVN